MGKQHEKKAAAASDQLFVFGIDDAGKPRGARFAELNNKVVNAAIDLKLTSVHSASAAFSQIAMKLPVGRLYASGKAFVPPIRRDLVEKLNAVLAAPGDESQASKPATNSAPTEESESTSEQPKVRVAGLPRTWDSVGMGSVVLAMDGPEDGWWECVVLKREDDVLTLRLRDYPKQGTYIRHLTQVALINPGSE
jgi:hypothetical protein